MKLSKNNSEFHVNLPLLHKWQIKIVNFPSRRKLLCCGRRWGKSYLVIYLAVLEVITKQVDGKYGTVGIFCPTHKLHLDLFAEICRILGPLAIPDKSNKRITIKHIGSFVEFWSLNDSRAGRSRSYSLVCIDEAAFVPDDGSNDPNNMSAIWERSIMPTLLDRPGSRAYLLSTPTGKSGFFYEAAMSGEWDVFIAPTSSNPHIPKSELEESRLTTDPLVWAQEFEAQFVDFAGKSFLNLDLMLSDGKPIEVPIHNNGSFTAIIGVMDTAFGGPDKINSDGTAYMIGALMLPTYTPDKKSHLYILDWGIEQISGELLKNYLENIANEACYWELQVKSRFGIHPIMVEDKGSGTVLLQQAKSSGLNATGVNNKLVNLGKDSRVLAVSRYLNQGQIHLTQHALEKEVVFKGKKANHFVQQLCQFSINDKSRHKKNDDLVDAFCYLVLETLRGDNEFN